MRPPTHLEKVHKQSTQKTTKGLGASFLRYNLHVLGHQKGRHNGSINGKGIFRAKTSFLLEYKGKARKTTGS